MQLTKRLTNKILKLVNSEIEASGHDVVATKIVDTTNVNTNGASCHDDKGVLDWRGLETLFHGKLVDEENNPVCAWTWVVEGKHPAPWSGFAIYTSLIFETTS